MGRMTGLAIGTKATLMTLFAVIVFFVTTDTFARSIFKQSLFRGILKRSLFVTVLAFGQTMLADQSKTGLAVIKANFFPVLFGMAVLAFLAQLALMGIILLVTGITSRWRITIFLSWLVTFLALDLALGMLAE
jgi:hypothetical protein